MNFTSQNSPPILCGDEPLGARMHTKRLNAPAEHIAQIKEHLGLNFGDSAHLWRVEYVQLGKIVNSSLNPLYTDARYEVELSLPKQSLKNKDLLALEKSKFESDSRRIITATNLSEIVLNTHQVPLDTPVQVFRAIREKSNKSAVHYYFTSGGIAGFFPVKVESTGGINGTKSAAASWTYTVRTIAWNGSSGGSVLGTGVALTRPRPAGRATVQAGSTGYGSAFYDGSTLKLWDAGEVYGVSACT